MIEKDLVNILKINNLIITTAESCTGGMIASRIVNVPGASAVFKQGYITYCDEAKISMLGVSRQTIGKFFAVSAETASEMAMGGAKKANADVCISVTGVAGPDTEDGKPVGLVYIGVCILGSIHVRECHFTGDRASIREQSAQHAMEYAVELLSEI
jgi:PncC family amidohydrolase